MAYIYLDGELISLPDVEKLGSVEAGGLVPLLKANGDVVGMASLATGGFVTTGEPPTVLEPAEDEDDEDDEDEM
jgi:hypothetical protein